MTGKEKTMSSKMMPPWIWQRFVLKEIGGFTKPNCNCKVPRHWLIVDQLKGKPISTTRLYTMKSATRELDRVHYHILDQLKTRPIEDILTDFEDRFQLGVGPNSLPSAEQVLRF